MKKSKLLILSAATLFATAVPLSTISCWLTQPIPSPKSKPDSKNPTQPNPNPNPGIPNKPQVDPNKLRDFKYDGQNYKIAKEDNLDRNAQYYADFVLENNAESFKKLLPTYKQYENVKDLSEDEYPTFANASQFIRSLEHYNRNFIFKSKKEQKSINAREYNTLISKLLAILEKSEIETAILHTQLFNDARSRTINDTYNLFKDTPKEWGKKVILSGGFIEDFEEVDCKTPGFRQANHKGKIKRQPSMLWKLNRFFDYEKGFINETFLSRQFYEKTLNHDEEMLDYDWFDFQWKNKTKVWAMQKPLWEMLIAYLKLQIKLTNSISINYPLDENELKSEIEKNGSIVDESKSLIKNFEDSGIYSLIVDFELKTLEYMKLLNLLGFTLEEGNDPSLQMFPGGTNYPYQTDFRDAYVWAYWQYHNIIQPLRMKLDKRINVENLFKKTFLDSTLKPYYEMIWANIKAVDEIDRPYLISESEANARFELIIKYYENRFNWKYKK